MEMKQINGITLMNYEFFKNKNDVNDLAGYVENRQDLIENYVMFDSNGNFIGVYLKVKDNLSNIREVVALINCEIKVTPQDKKVKTSEQLSKFAEKNLVDLEKLYKDFFEW